MPHKGMKKIVKTERAFHLEKLVERKDDIEGADVKDFQAGKKRKEAFSYVTKEFNEEFPEATREISQVIDIWRRAKMNAKGEICTSEKQKENRGWTRYYGNFKGVKVGFERNRRSNRTT